MDGLRLGTPAECAAGTDRAQQLIVAGEIQLARSIAAWCDLHRVDETVAVAGAEQWIQVGAPGTPMVGEFLAGEIAALLGISVGSAFAKMAEILNIRHRHPALWVEVLAGRMRLWEAGKVAGLAANAQLGEAACARFDRLCATALRVQPWSRVRRQVSRWLIQVDPVTARERREARARERFARVGRIEDGHVQWWAQLDAADALAFDEALTRVSGVVAGDTVDQRRATAVGVIARQVLGVGELPGVARVPPRPARRDAELVVRCDATDLVDPATGVVEVDRWGVVLTDQLVSLLADAKVTVRPVLMSGDVGPVDGYRVPDRMRRWVAARNPVDVFPYGVTPAWVSEMDHTIAYDHDNPVGKGQTKPGNLGPLSKFSHRLKTHGRWRLTQPVAGLFRWQSPLGYVYWCDANGTTKDRPPSPPSRQKWYVLRGRFGTADVLQFRSPVRRP